MARKESKLRLTLEDIKDPFSVPPEDLFEIGLEYELYYMANSRALARFEAGLRSCVYVVEESRWGLRRRLIPKPKYNPVSAEEEFGRLINLSDSQRGQDKQGRQFKYHKAHVVSLGYVLWVFASAEDDPCQLLFPRAGYTLPQTMVQVFWTDEKCTFETRTTLRRLLGGGEADKIIFAKAAIQEAEFSGRRPKTKDQLFRTFLNKTKGKRKKPYSRQGGSNEDDTSDDDSDEHSTTSTRNNEDANSNGSFKAESDAKTKEEFGTDVEPMDIDTEPRAQGHSFKKERSENHIVGDNQHEPEEADGLRGPVDDFGKSYREAVVETDTESDLPLRLSPTEKEKSRLGQTGLRTGPEYGDADAKMQLVKEKQVTFESNGPEKGTGNGNGTKRPAPIETKKAPKRTGNSAPQTPLSALKRSPRLIDKAARLKQLGKKDME
jgi:hypothetical protein